jgi:hypothetical protein
MKGARGEQDTYATALCVGRVKWIEDSPFTGKDNCAWHLFDASIDAPAQFIGRAA